jgi:hypothetical protein
MTGFALTPLKHFHQGADEQSNLFIVALAVFFAGSAFSPAAAGAVASGESKVSNVSCNENLIPLASYGLPSVHSLYFIAVLHPDKKMGRIKIVDFLIMARCSFSNGRMNLKAGLELLRHEHAQAMLACRGSLD